MHCTSTTNRSNYFGHLMGMQIFRKVLVGVIELLEVSNIAFFWLDTTFMNFLTMHTSPVAAVKSLLPW